MSDKFTESDKKLAMERMKYNVANNLKKEDRLTQKDLNDAKKIVKARMKYLIKDNEALGGARTEDRLTQRDIENSTKTIKEVNEFSTGGDVVVGKGGDYIKDLID